MDPNTQYYDFRGNNCSINSHLIRIVVTVIIINIIIQIII